MSGTQISALNGGRRSAHLDDRFCHPTPLPTPICSAEYSGGLDMQCRSVSGYAPWQESALWEGVARCHEQGLVRAVGVSNYGVRLPAASLRQPTSGGLRSAFCAHLPLLFGCSCGRGCHPLGPSRGAAL